MLAARQRAPAVAQAEQRVELLDQLGGGRAPAHRADADRVAGGRLARDLEDRERDVEPAAQVDVAVGLGLAAHVARRAQRLDQPVLEQQRAQLGLGHLVVDVLGLGGPGRAGREVRARPRAQVDRLADVQRPAVGVAEDVDAGLVRERRRGAAGRRARGGPSPAACGPCARRAARSRRRSSARSRTGARTARRRPARTSARPAARDGPRRPRPRARRPASPARGGAAAARSGARARPCRSPAAPATPAPRARTPGAARARRRPRCGRPAPARAAASLSRGSTSSGAGAASTIACEMPVKRWMPRPSGLATPTSESHSSCSSPPPTSTAPTSVSSQRSPARPLVSVSRAMNSAEARGRSSMDRTASARDRTVQRRLRAPCTTVRGRAPPLVLIAVLALAGCGGSEQRENELRPPPGTLTAAIQDDVVRVSPQRRRRADRPARLQPVRRAADGDLRDRRARGGAAAARSSPLIAPGPPGA